MMPRRKPRKILYNSFNNSRKKCEAFKCRKRQIINEQEVENAILIAMIVLNVGQRSTSHVVILKNVGRKFFNCKTTNL